VPELPVSTGHPSSSPLESLRSGVRQRQMSPEGRVAWRLLRQAALLTAVSLLCTALLPGLWRNLAGGVVAAAAAAAVLRLLWPAIGGRRFWRWSLLISVVLLLIPWWPLTVLGRTLLSILVFVLVVLRHYRYLPELGSRRRAAVWLAAVGLIVGFIAVRGPAESSTGVTHVLRHLHGVARYLLVIFWVMNIVWIFLGVRLHFLRMRPKLAVAGMLLAAVPVGLILVLGVIGGWSLLGAGRAEQAASMFDDWLMLAGAGDVTGESPFSDAFTASGEGVMPEWHTDAADAIEHAPFDPMPPAIWYSHSGELWALHIGEADNKPILVGGRRIAHDGLMQVAERTGCVVAISGEGSGEFVIGLDDDWEGTGGYMGEEIFTDSGDSSAILIGWPASVGRDAVVPGEGGRGLLDRLIPFGGTHIAGWTLEDRGLARDEMVLGLRTRPRDVFGYFTSRDNDFNVVVLIGLLSIAIVFLFLQLFAFYFGLRIVGGVTGAVGELHKATEKLARGDLETTISLPNEDEFGDLADSFNEMTTAIRVAQDQIVQKQLLEAQLDTARGIQQRLLPAAMPSVPGYEIAGSSDPSLQVGGDYFDFVEMPDGRMGIAVADVTGKGVPAALLMANVQAGLHGQAMHPGTAAEIIGRMNDLMYESTDPHMFVTFALVMLDPSSGRVESVSAGHEPTLLVRPDGSWEKLEAGGLMLGMMPGFEYSEVQAAMEPGDVLVMYTDGVTEAMGPAPEPVPVLEAEAGSLTGSSGADDEDEDEDDEPILPFFEEHRLVDICVERRHESAEQIRAALLAAIRNFAQDVPQSDDITIVVIKRDKAA
jgi:serine phosphatase RsbU (regulator of sigma subunit)